jgi:hypothetical protein
MRRTAAVLSLLLISSTTFAGTLLTCVPSDQLHGQISSLTLKENGAQKTVLFKHTKLAKIASQAGNNSLPTESEMTVLRVVDNVSSQKYVIEKHPDGSDFSSLIVNLNSKKAVLIYEIPEPRSPIVHFLDCK